MTIQTPRILWKPTKEFVDNSNLKAFENWLTEKGVNFNNYDEMWEWSVEHIDEFWEAIYQYFQIEASGSFDRVRSSDQMPNVRWFEGLKLNYAEHIFRNKNTEYPAIIFKREDHEVEEISWQEMERQVASFAQFLKSKGIGKGDRVVGFIPNIPQASIASLATCSLGAIWSSCSPDFGASSVVDRFKQIEPKVLIVVDGYQYGGKTFDRSDVVQQVLAELKELECVVQLPYLKKTTFLPQAVHWDETVKATDLSLDFVHVDFNDPIWVLYSSGTTGAPKAITHSQGGVLLEHLKYVTFHNDVKFGERYFWFTTTGWMMWNFVQATLLVGATIVLYDGSPGYPNMSSLWQLASDLKINHFGTSAPFILASSKAGLEPKELDLSKLRSISSTGSPLPPEGFAWIYEHVKDDLWFCSMSGGTDVCSAFVGGCPSVPLHEGEIQRRALGAAVYAFDEAGNSLINQVGEMVITKPMPSMPIFFWNDSEKARYKESYFDTYENIWRHGDWIKITNRNSILILGRSDATLNRHGIRIGSAEIYQSIHKIEEIKDSLVVNLERESGDHFMPLFILMNDGETLSDDLVQKLKSQIRSDYTSRHVPDAFVEVAELPYTISGKKMESAVKKLLMGVDKERAASAGAMKNPDSLGFFEEYYLSLK